jgi:hypothetical protein
MLKRHCHRFAAGTFALVFLALPLEAGIARAADAPKAKAYSDPRELRISPQSAPVPALKYRLLPLEGERTPGDAAPIYIRLAGLATTEGMREITRRTTGWANLPLDGLPVAECRKFVDQWTGALRQLQFGARRQTCNWNYTLNEQKEQVIEVLMPDVQDIRTWARLLALKARVEMAERKYDAAVTTLETGIALSRHAGGGPFAINALVGVACAQTMLGCVEEMTTLPDAPNLYWALTTLPRPLVGLRQALETERMQPHWLFPELDEVDRPHSADEWPLLLARLHRRMKAIEERIMVTDSTGSHPKQPRLTDVATFKAEALPAARAYFQERPAATSIAVDEHVLLSYIAGRCRELYDDQFKYAYLPYPEAIAARNQAEEQLKALKGGPLDVFTELMTSVIAALRAEARLERTVAAARTIEALRLHAAGRGTLPGSLDEVTIVPVPLDPVTGKPFTYRREGETAVLIGPDSVPQTVLTYRITLRK